MPKPVYRLTPLLVAALLLPASRIAAAPPASPDLRQNRLFAAAEGAPPGRPLLARLGRAFRNLGDAIPKSRGPVDIEVFKKAAPATVLVLTNNGFGTGSLIDAQGAVLTNNHVIADAREIAVVFRPKDGNPPTRENALPASVIRADPLRDLALLHVARVPVEAAVLPLGDMDKLQVGEDVHAIGHPEGEDWTYTSGVISQIRRNYEWSDGQVKHRQTVIQTQTPLNPGNSGGPLLNDQGELVGVNTFVRRDASGMSYAVAVETVRQFLDSPAGPLPQAPAHPERPKGSSSGARSARYGDSIVGVYVLSSKPPPDLWLVYRDDPNEPAYAARGMQDRHQIDLVIVRDADGTRFLADSDCDGTIDVVAFSSNGRDIDGYAPPQHPTRLTNLAREIATALATHTIPMRDVRICQ